jgi:hypothetical protein
LKKMKTAKIVHAKITSFGSSKSSRTRRQLKTS